MKIRLFVFAGLTAVCLSAAQITSDESLSATFNASGPLTFAGAGLGADNFTFGVRTGSLFGGLNLGGGLFSGGALAAAFVGINVQGTHPGDSMTGAFVDVTSQTVRVTNSGSTAASFTFVPTASFSGQTMGPTSAGLTLFMAFEQFDVQSSQWLNLSSVMVTLPTDTMSSCSSNCISGPTVMVPGGALSPSFVDVRAHVRIDGGLANASVPEPATLGTGSASLILGLLLRRRVRKS